MDKRLLTVVLAAVLVALVITAIFYQITSRRPAQAAVDTKLLVVAKADLPMGSVITENDLRVIDFPENAYPRDGYQDIAEVVDRSVTQQILSNEAVTASRVTEKGAGFGLAPLIPDGYRAVAIAVNQVSGVSGFLMPGSKVDVLLSAIPRGGEERLTTTVLENISVLSTGQKQQPDANGQPQNVPVVNLLLTPEDSELLTLATQEGKIQLVLRNPKDSELRAEDRRAFRSRDLFLDFAPRQAPRPSAPRVVRVQPVEPPPPPAFEVEMIRGNKRSVETIDGAQEQ